MERTSAEPKPWWRRGTVAWALIPATLFVLLLTVASARQGGPPGSGDRAPDFEAPLLASEGTFGTDDLNGTPYVLNFWASWCAPCKDESPMLKEASERYAGEVQFVGIDIRDTESDAIAFVEEEGLDYPHVRDERLDIYRDYGLTGQPETFFVDSSGVVLEHVNG
ncbi:MAG: cytochrome c biosis protein CcmG, thiol:disulfide interchange protein DsbE, partial [Actinomycetota bacterium]|nr:cytochrome c biosis protein CcmG, thiol:disulfide interchange protein DsbE [Actinomycetota bacterium]